MHFSTKAKLEKFKFIDVEKLKNKNRERYLAILHFTYGDFFVQFHDLSTF